MSTQLPDTYNVIDGVRAYAVGLVMATIEPSTFGVQSPNMVIEKAEILTKYIMSGPQEKK